MGAAIGGMDDAAPAQPPTIGWAEHSATVSRQGVVGLPAWIHWHIVVDRAMRYEEQKRCGDGERDQEHGCGQAQADSQAEWELGCPSLPLRSPRVLADRCLVSAFKKG
jgi:hypothetical protein